MTTRKKKFGNKTYWFYGHYDLKSKAKLEADKIRWKGWQSRTVKIAKGYEVWAWNGYN